MSYIDNSVAQLTVFEGSIPFCYLDTRGFVTVGVGQMIPDAGAACTLPFQSARGPAHVDEIVYEWSRVKKMEPGHKPSFYYVEESLTLLAQDIAKILRSRVVGFDGQLQGYYRDYPEFPDFVKLALLDMIYNLGFSGLAAYKQMNAAVNARDWTKAALECHRNGPSEDRNIWCKNQFLEAA